MKMFEEFILSLFAIPLCDCDLQSVNEWINSNNIDPMCHILNGDKIEDATQDKWAQLSSEYKDNMGRPITREHVWLLV